MAFQAAGVNDAKFISLFALSWTKHCRDNNICMAKVFRSVKAEKGVSFNRTKLHYWRTERIDRPVLVYSINALCEAVGLSILDFVEVKNPVSPASRSLSSDGVLPED